MGSMYIQGGYRIIDIEDNDIFTTLKEVTESETKPLLVKGVNGTTDHFATVSDLKIITDDNGDISEIDVPLGELSYNSSTGKHTQYIARVTPSSFTTEEVEVTSGDSTELTYEQIEAACRPSQIINDEVVIINPLEDIINNWNDIFFINLGNESLYVKIKDTDGNNMLDEEDPSSERYSHVTYYAFSILDADDMLSGFTNQFVFLRLKYLEKELTLIIYLALGVLSQKYRIKYKFHNYFQNAFNYTFYDTETNPYAITNKTYSINDLLAKDEDGTDTNHIYFPINFNICNYEFVTSINNENISYEHPVDWDFVDRTNPRFNCTINTTVSSLDDTFITFTKVS